MDQVAELGVWLKQGCQRHAVARVLRKPMTPNEIWRAARLLAPRIQLRDVWFLLRQMQAKGLVRCLNPNTVTGKLFVYSEFGRAVAASAGITLVIPPASIDWDHYSWVVRGSVRKLVLTELGRPRFPSVPGLTPSQIKRHFRGRYPVGKNLILRALQELTEKDLVLPQRLGKRSLQKSYVLTDAGQQIYHAIMA